MARTRQQRAGQRRTGPERRPAQAPARSRPDPEVLPAAHGPGHPRPDRGVPLLGRLLRRAGPDRARWRFDSRQAGRMGPGPLPGPGGDVRRVDLVQPAQDGRQAGLLAGGPGRRGTRQDVQAHPRVRAGHPAQARLPGRPCAARRGRLAGAGDGQGLPGHLRHVPAAERGVQLLRGGPGLDGPAAGQVRVAPGRRRPGPGSLEGLDVAPAGHPQGPAGHLQRRVLVHGAASVVYYRDGTIKIGSWGRELRMTPDVAGVRQNLKLLVDHGKVPATVDQNVNTTWGATLGGGYYVWRSGLGITRDGRVIFVYGPALNVRELASLLRRAGAVEALQLDINPEWMSYDYYKAGGHPRNPTPHALLPTQQGSVYRYYQIYSRDFTVVYA